MLVNAVPPGGSLPKCRGQRCGEAMPRDRPRIYQLAGQPPSKTFFHPLCAPQQGLDELRRGKRARLLEETLEGERQKAAAAQAAAAEAGLAALGVHRGGASMRAAREGGRAVVGIWQRTTPDDHMHVYGGLARNR